MMFTNHGTISSRSSSGRSGIHSIPSIPSLRMRNPLGPKTSFNPLFRHSDALTSFDASNFVFQDSHESKKEKKKSVVKRNNSHDSYRISSPFEESYRSSDVSNSHSIQSRLASNESGSSERKTSRDYCARDFLERYSLPRVVTVDSGEPLLLYRCFDSFTKVQAKAVLGLKKGREKVDENVLHFPEGYSGWFSLTNNKGERSAVVHTTILQLVREQVCSFLSVQPFTAYATQSSDLKDASGKLQYFKTQVRGGQFFQLRAVFQHKERPEGLSGRNSTRSSRISRSVRDKDLANRYAQLVSQSNQELYVPLTTKGEFFEIHTSMKAKLCFPGMLDKTGPLALDRDCLYKITHLLRRMPLPVKVKLMSGPLPRGLPKDFTDTFILEKKFQEPLLVTCTLPPPSPDARYEISCLNLNSKLKLTKSTLGFDSESRLFKSQRLQGALSFCHKNVEGWYREVRLVPNIQEPPVTIESCQNCKRSLKECTDLGGCITSDVEEKEKQIITKEALEKFPKPKKWYQHFKLKSSQPESELPMDVNDKSTSMDRYKDMSKIIEEKLGKKSSNPVKKSASFMFSTKRVDLEKTPGENAALLKCQSLDTQLYSNGGGNYSNSNVNVNRRDSKSNVSESLSYDFQMCILENESTRIEPAQVRVNFDKIEAVPLPPMKDINDFSGKLRKTKPDLIPTLPKDSFITERLCNEFQVKTKIQKRPVKFTVPDKAPSDVQKVVVQIHKSSKTARLFDDIPYSNVADQVSILPTGRTVQPKDENIYAEICEDLPPSNESKCACDRICTCADRTNRIVVKNSDYCYVKLGSNGDSVVSDSDEGIYNTLR